jgi:hypothetical protein
MFHTGLFLCEDAKYGESERFVKLCVERMTLELGPRHEDTLRGMRHAYSRQGRLDEAVEVVERGLSIATENLGRENLTTCTLLDEMVYLHAR